MAQIGGVFRDENGCWVLGFNRSIGSCNVLDAELWSIHKGLKVAKNQGFYHLVNETDSLTACYLLNIDVDCGMVQNLVDTIKFQIKEVPNVKVVHCFRELNQLADLMARAANVNNCTLKIYHSVPTQAKELLEDERVKMGSFAVLQFALFFL